MMCKVFTVKQQQITMAVLMAAGVVCFLTALLAPVDEHTKGFLCGAGSAVLVIGLVRSIQLWRLSRDPERVRDYEASQNEERTAFIIAQSMKTTLAASMIAEYAMGIVFLLAGQSLVGAVLCWLVVGQTALWMLLRAVYQKKY